MPTRSRFVSSSSFQGEVVPETLDKFWHRKMAELGCPIKTCPMGGKTPTNASNSSCEAHAETGHESLRGVYGGAGVHWLRLRKSPESSSQVEELVQQNGCRALKSLVLTIPYVQEVCQVLTVSSSSRFPKRRNLANNLSGVRVDNRWTWDPVPATGKLSDSL